MAYSLYSSHWFLRDIRLRLVFLVSKDYLCNKFLKMAPSIYTKIHLLPPNRLEELMLFVDFLLHQEAAPKPLPTKRRQFGCAKGKIKMSMDFDAPLDDFKEYMP
jgi:Protein of unknown function (DUF2281)